MNQGAEGARATHSVEVGPRRFVARDGDAVTHVEHRPSPGGAAPRVRALIALPKSFADRQWLPIGEGGVESEQPLTDDDVRDLVSSTSATDPYARKGSRDVRPPRTLQLVSVLFLVEKADASEDVLPALVRRVRDVLASDEAPRGRVLEIGVVRIDKEAHRATVFGRPITLTALEFRLLLTLAERRDRVQSRSTLLNDVWECGDRVRTRTVDTHITRLRDKLRAAGSAIETVRNVGYRFSGYAATAAREGAILDRRGRRSRRGHSRPQPSLRKPPTLEEVQRLMANHHATPSTSPNLPDGGGNDLHRWTTRSRCCSRSETENALRWGARGSSSSACVGTPSALVVTARLLDQMGRRRAAIEGLRLAVQQATAEESPARHGRRRRSAFLRSRS